MSDKANKSTCTEKSPNECHAAKCRSRCDRTSPISMWMVYNTYGIKKKDFCKVGAEDGDEVKWCNGTSTERWLTDLYDSEIDALKRVSEKISLHIRSCEREIQDGRDELTKIRRRISEL